jgi:hypothetical protein
MPNTATKEQVSKDLDDTSTMISNLVRTSALGVLAVSWGLLVTSQSRIQVAAWAILIAIAFAFIALLLDWAQYLVGYVNGLRTWDAMESDGTLRGWSPDWFYALRKYLFAAKQAFAFAGVLILVGALVPAIARLL